MLFAINLPSIRTIEVSLYLSKAKNEAWKSKREKSRKQIYIQVRRLIFQKSANRVTIKCNDFCSTYSNVCYNSVHASGRCWVTPGGVQIGFYETEWGYVRTRTGRLYRLRRLQKRMPLWLYNHGTGRARLFVSSHRHDAVHPVRRLRSSVPAVDTAHGVHIHAASIASLLW